MYAVIKTGGKQYKVAKDEVLAIEKLAGDTGDSVSFEQVLMLSDGETTTLGRPTVAGALVTAEVVEQTRGPKIIVFKKNRRQNYRRKKGHRQDLTKVRITDILAEGSKPKKAAAKPKKAAAKKAPKTKAPAEAEAAADSGEA